MPSFVRGRELSCACPDGYVGEVWYLKAQCSPEDSPELSFPEFVIAFKREHEEFPHKSTLVQWYDWFRFEAYRQLGYSLTQEVLCGWDEEACESLSGLHGH